MASDLLNFLRTTKIKPFSPFYALSVPVLFSLTLPLAFFATLTTLFACTILLFRLLIIYTEIAFELIPHYLFRKSRNKDANIPAELSFYQEPSATTGQNGSVSAPTYNYNNLKSTGSSGSSSTISWAEPQYTPSQSRAGYRDRRNRKTSLPCIQLSPPMGADTNNTSGATINSYISTTTPTPASNKPTFSLPIYSSPAPGARDFEGLGGWRLNSTPEDTLLFTSINSRLELPSITEHSPRHLHHRRSLTSNSIDLSSTYNAFLSGRDSRRLAGPSRSGSFAGQGNYNVLKKELDQSSRRNSSANISVGRSRRGSGVSLGGLEAPPSGLTGLDAPRNSLASPDTQKASLSPRSTEPPLLSPRVTATPAPTPMGMPGVPSPNLASRLLFDEYFPKLDSGLDRNGTSMGGGAGAGLVGLDAKERKKQESREEREREDSGISFTPKRASFSSASSKASSATSDGLNMKGK